MPVARTRRPKLCVICEHRIEAGQEYQRCIRFAKAGEEPTFHGNRLAEEVHETPCVDAWEEKFMPERHRRKHQKDD